MRHKVDIELATRAVVRLEAMPADVQHAFHKQLVRMGRALERQMTAHAVPNPAVLPRLVQLKQGRERIYRVLFGVKGVDHYITFRWPKRPLDDSGRSVMLVLSVGNWEERFRAWCKKRQRRS